MRVVCFSLLFSLCLWASVVHSHAAEPTVRNVNVRGLQVGGTTTITIDGDDLGKSPQLFLPFPAQQTLKPSSTDKKAEFTVTLDKSLPPGLYHLRVVTEGGASAPVVIGVDRLTQQPLGVQIEALPAALHGSVTGSTIAETQFTGKANEKVTIEVEAQRIGSKLRPVIHLYSPKKLQLGWAWGIPTLEGDARIEATLPSDGTYTITIHDAEYAGANPGYFRLKVGRFGYIDQVFPPIIGTSAKTVELLGSVSETATLPSVKANALLLPWPKGELWAGPRPWVTRSSRTELLEPTEAGKVLELPGGSIGVSGKLSAPYEEDRFKIAVKPNTKVRFEVFAERIGSPVDTALVLRNEAGAVVAQNEDRPDSLDPVLEYALPDKVTSVVIAVSDSSGRGGPRSVYRLVVDPVTDEGLGDFQLTTPMERLTLSTGGTVIMPVFVDRRGYRGTIDITAEGLPTGATPEGGTITPDADGTLVKITANKNLTPSLSLWKGRGDNGHTGDMTIQGHPLARLQPWLASELSVAPTSFKASDFSIDWKDLPKDAALIPADKLALPITVKRLDPALPVRLTLLTSQRPPLNANNQPDPNRTIRPERAVEIAAKSSDGALSLLVPPELPADSYQIAVQAELLTANKQKVLATAYTPIQNFAIKLPVSLMAAATKFEAKAGTMVELKGSAIRHNGFAGDIVVTLTGLPTGVPTPAPVTVKAAETAFVMKLNVPPTAQPTEATLKLSATAIPDPKRANIRVKSRELDVTLIVIAAK